MNRHTNFAETRAAFISFILLFLFILGSCGKSAANRQHSSPAGRGASPEPGNSQQAVVHFKGQYESFLLNNGVLYAGSDNGSVYALQAGDGQPLWHTDTGSPVALFALMNGKVYAAGGPDQYNTIFALNAQTGRLLWKFKVNTPISGDVADNGVIYLNTNSEGDHYSAAYALNGATGALLWRYTGQIDMPDSLVVSSGIVYLPIIDPSTEQASLIALRASDGHYLWQFNFRDRTEGTPIVVNGVVYITSASDVIYALQASTGQIVWKALTYANTLPLISPDIVNGTLIVGANVMNTKGISIQALRVSDGSRLWSYNPPYSFPDLLLAQAPMVSNGVVYAATLSKKLFAVSLSDGKLLWQREYGGSMMRWFTARNNAVYVNDAVYGPSTLNSFYAYRTGDGAMLWQHSASMIAPWKIGYLTQVIGSGNVYLGTAQGIVEALRESDGAMQWQYKI